MSAAHRCGRRSRSCCRGWKPPQARNDDDDDDAVAVPAHGLPAPEVEHVRAAGCLAEVVLPVARALLNRQGVAA